MPYLKCPTCNSVTYYHEEYKYEPPNFCQKDGTRLVEGTEEEFRKMFAKTNDKQMTETMEEC
jgi:hypothetical protein